MMLQPATSQLKAAKGIVKLFLIIFLGVGAVLAGVISLIYQLQTESYVERLKENERFAVQVESQIVEKVFKDVSADLDYLSHQETLQNFLADSGEQTRSALEQEYLYFARAMEKYDQIRYLDQTGMEVVRVNFKRGQPEVVPRAELQNKANRYYFPCTASLQRGRMFVSPLDLNVEHGELEIPFKPMIRFGMVVFDQTGARRGIVLLNYLGETLLDELRQAGKAMYGQPLLLNRDGYWLLGPKPSDEWGFMLPDRKDRTLPNLFPLAASHLKGEQEGQFITKEGMFSFATIYPLLTGQQSSQVEGGVSAQSQGELRGKQYYWRLISHIDRDKLDGYTFDLLVNLTLLGVALFSLTALASWLIAGAIIRKRMHRLQLYNLAHFDALTGLPNRVMFFDRLRQTYEASKRHGRRFAILYVDLDDFKAINDTMGHSAGDLVLKLIAQRMLDVVRKSDTVARMGGDEFMIILSELARVGDAELVTQKLLQVLTRPMELHKKQASVGASIGLVIFPDDSEDMEQLIPMADEAMYACKAKGKNHYQTFANLKTGDQGRT